MLTASLVRVTAVAVASLAADLAAVVLTRFSRSLNPCG